MQRWTTNSRRALAIAAVSVVGLVFAACAASFPEPTRAVQTAAKATPLVVNLSTAISTLDPAEETGATNQLISQAVYTRLLEFGSSPGPDGTTQIDYGVLKPSLAKSWSVSSTGLVYTFILHNNFKFADGTPITAADVKFSFERMLTMGGSGEFVIDDEHESPSTIKTIAAPTPTKLVITLAFPDTEVLDVWTTPYASIVEPSLVDAHGGVVANQINTWMAGHIAGGGGPYDLTSYQAGVRAILTANPHSPTPPKSHQVIVNFISDAATLALDARDGEADISVGLPDVSVHSLQHTSGVKIALYSTPESEQLGFNTTVAPGNNEDFRKAVALAVPYKELLGKLVFGYGKLFRGEWPPIMSEFNPSAEKQVSQNLSMAKSLLKQSGLHLPVTLPIVVESGDLAASEIGPVLESVLQPLGVNVSLVTQSPSVYEDTLDAHTDQAYITLDGPGVPQPGYLLGYDMLCGVAYNETATCIPKVDSLFKTASTTVASKQLPLWNQIDQLIVAYTPRIQFYGYDAPVVLNDRVNGFEYDFQLGGGIQTWSLR